MPFLRLTTGEHAVNKPLVAWQPIETAPRDGTYLLVSNAAGNGSWVAHWMQFAVSGYRFENPWRSMMLNHDHMPYKTRYLPPTHWMPMPEPPNA